MVRIITLNLNGIRSAHQKGAFDWLKQQNADVICLQELKAQEADMNAQMLDFEGYHAFFHCAEKKGYSGVGLYLRKKPLKVTSGVGDNVFDGEGRYIQADYDTFSVVSLYLPSGSSSPERQIEKFRFMEHFAPRLADLRQSGREVVICGDWNIAHQEIDLKNWKSNKKNSGFLPEERSWIGKLFNEQAWVDVYRYLHPTTTDDCYTWWSNRGQAWAKNVGWRLDYQIATPGFAKQAEAAAIYKTQRFSDHAPLIIDYDFKG